jgi:hypothetical protein
MNVNKALDKVEKYYFFILLILYAVAVLYINPFGQFAVNDDWDFYTHVRNFMQLDFVKNRFIDSSFVLQGLLGSVWARVFGLSFTSLKTLTIIVTILFLFGLCKILDQLKLNVWIKVLAGITIMFNPFVLMSSLTFMTEMYFLTVILWSVYFLIKYVESARTKYAFLAVLVGTSSILIRQVGFLFVPGIILSLLLIALMNKFVIRWKYVFCYALIFGAFSAIAVFWPQYSLPGDSKYELMLKSARGLLDYKRLLDLLYYYIPYFGLCLLPLGVYMFGKLPLLLKVALLWIASQLYMSFYVYDIFRFGNVFYPEGLMIKNNYVAHITLYDNVIFKPILSLVVLVAAFSVITYLLLEWLNPLWVKVYHATEPFLPSFLSKYLLIKPRIIITERSFISISVSLAVLFVFLTLPVLAYKKLFDRYLVNGLVLAVIWVCVSIRNTERVSTNSLLHAVNYTVGFLIAIVYVVYSVSLNQDFFTTTRLQWKQVADLRAQGVEGSIFLSDTYLKFDHIFSKPNNERLSVTLTGEKYRCYSQKLVISDSANPVYKYLAHKERNHSKITSDPTPYEGTYFPGFRLPTLVDSKIRYKQETFVLQEMLVGNKTFIETYCEY